MKNQMRVCFCSPRLRVCRLPLLAPGDYLRIKVEGQLWFRPIKSSLLTHFGDEPFRIRDVQFN